MSQFYVEGWLCSRFLGLLQIPSHSKSEKVAHLSIPLSVFGSNYVAFIFLANFCSTVSWLEPYQWMTFPKSCNSRRICTDYCMTRARLCLSLPD
jgi:hypothetical protein